MKINQKLLDKNLVLAKKLIAGMVKKEDKLMIIPIQKLNRELCLVVANFQCQKCGVKKCLQFHHLIKRSERIFINDKWRYLSQRYYWANVIVLCNDCHNETHEYRNGHGKSISEIFIKELKLKYKDETTKVS